jgi:uncharacterized membrane protein
MIAGIVVGAVLLILAIAIVATSFEHKTITRVLSAIFYVTWLGMFIVQWIGIAQVQESGSCYEQSESSGLIVAIIVLGVIVILALIFFAILKSRHLSLAFLNQCSRWFESTRNIYWIARFNFKTAKYLKQHVI